MGAKLEKIYQIVEEKAGTNGRIKFVQATKVTKAQAAEMKDEPEVISAFKRIASEVLGKNIDDLGL